MMNNKQKMLRKKQKEKLIGKYTLKKEHNQKQMKKISTSKLRKNKKNLKD